MHISNAGQGNSLRQSKAWQGTETRQSKARHIGMPGKGMAQSLGRVRQGT
jgi:hypothetical protein